MKRMPGICRAHYLNRHDRYATLKLNLCGFTPSERSSLNRDRLDFCVKVKKYFGYYDSRRVKKSLYV